MIEFREDDFNKAADAANDVSDHDELHAAAAVIWFAQNDVDVLTNDYIRRWLKGLARRHDIDIEQKPQVELTVRTRHPERYRLLNVIDATEWVIEDGRWVEVRE